MTIVFLHIPHTGGTSLLDVIRRQYAPGEMYEAYEKSPHTIEDFIALSDDQKRNVKLFAAHVSYGIHQVIPGETRYFTFLRDPMKRVLSDYNRIITRPDHYLHQTYKEEGVSVEEHIRRAKSSDIQLRQIIGRPLDRLGNVRSHRDPLPENPVEVAKDHLRSFALVGLTEQFDTSLLLLKKEFGWGKLYYVRQNTSEKAVTLETLAPQTGEMLREMCAPEIELYEYAKTLMSEQVARYGAGFADELRHFTVENARYAERQAQIGRVTETIKRPLRPLWRKLRTR